MLNELLSEGTANMTWRATHQSLRKPVILKTLRGPAGATAAPGQPQKQQFITTAHQLARCQHPGLATVLDTFEDGGRPFVVLDHVPGESLAVRVQRKGPLPEARALHYIQQAASALSLLHRNQTVHGDVKPENLVRPPAADFVVLVDFGQPHPGNPAIAPGQTPNAYAAPELGKSPATPASDVYGLAATLYFLVTGKVPLRAVLRTYEPLPPPRQLQPQLSAQLEAAILSGMALPPQSRPATIAAWLAQLPQAEQALPPLTAFSGGNVQPVLPNVPAPKNPETSPPVPPSAPKTKVVSPASPTNGKVPSARSPRKSFSLTKGLATAAILCGVLGAGVGLALRMGGTTGPGTTLFHTEQAFPPAAGWPQSARPTDPPNAPNAPQPPLEPRTPPAIAPAIPQPQLDPEPTYELPPDAAPLPSPDPMPLPETDPSVAPVNPTGTEPLSPSLPSPARSTAPVEPAPAIAPSPAAESQSAAPIPRPTTEPTTRPGG